MNGNCKLENVVYQANIFTKEDNIKVKADIGMSSLNGSLGIIIIDNLLITPLL